MHEKIIAGWDPGRLNNKLYLEDRKIINMNAICSGYERRTLEEETGDLINFLDVDIYRNEEFLGRYFVGSMAYRFNRGDLRWSTNGIPKFQDVETGNDEIVKLVTHLAYANYKPKEQIVAYYRLGTGVPTEEYFEQPQLLNSFTQVLKHEYKVVFKHPLFRDAVVKVKIPDVHFKPEGTASVVSMCYTDDLKPNNDVKRHLEKGCIIGLNIGSSTSDVAFMNSKMQFESYGFFGLPVGSSNPLNEIRSKLYKEYGYDVTKVKLDYLIRNYPKVKYKGKTINLEEIQKQPFANMVSLLKTKFFDKVEMKGMDIGEAGALFISGGTSIMTERELHNFIPGVPTIMSSDPLFEDARGYFLEAKFNAVKEKETQKQIFSNEEIEVE
ncbi:ParM/StbA family protein [Alkaliphilus pronyensis]|uniref:ParM/StbA family protein n=1 Tax=Alkaliphilus pronyensis TaxID=1482732 RepID=A0A6I0FHK7_9FIRM|nr:ParM/StbA family protein [Alkaliphilus pronyensis]KAB3535651.1 ParM/StbA family protein [Alkaliphilus pronyensis]